MFDGAGQIRLEHVQWLCEAGEELERLCEFSVAFKYYYAGKVYFAKLDNIKIHETLGIDPFDHDQLFNTMYRALKAMAVIRGDWAAAHPGVLLSEALSLNPEQQALHLRHCLGIVEARPNLQHVRESQGICFWICIPQ